MRSGGTAGMLAMQARRWDKEAGVQPGGDNSLDLGSEMNPTIIEKRCVSGGDVVVEE